MKIIHNHSRLLSYASLVMGLLVMGSLTGCALFKKDVILHPITGSDIVLLKQGETLTAPKQGAFLSDFYMTEIMEARVSK